MVKIIGQDAFGQRLIIDIERGRVIDMLRPALGRSCEAGFNSLPGRATGPVLKHVIGRHRMPGSDREGNPASGAICAGLPGPIRRSRARVVYHPWVTAPRISEPLDASSISSSSSTTGSSISSAITGRPIRAGAEDQQPAGHGRYQHPENDRHQAGGKPASEHRREL
jgi:hypothetical protein